MDKKNSIIGFLMLAAAILLLQTQSRQQATPQPEEGEQPASVQPAEDVADPFFPAAPLPVDDSYADVDPYADVDFVQTIAPEKLAPAGPAPEMVTLGNEFIEVDFTTRGGAIHEIRFLTTNRGGLDDYVFNQDATQPALELSRKRATGGFAPISRHYEKVAVTRDSVAFRYDTGRGLVFERIYRLGSYQNQDPYTIQHETRLLNQSKNPVQVSELFLNIGTAFPAGSDMMGEFHAYAYHTDRKEVFIKSGHFTGSSGFLGFGSKLPRKTYEQSVTTRWASVKNQFFVSVLTPETPASSVFATATPVANPLASAKPTTGISGELGFDTGVILAGGEKSIRATFYAGPKEYSRLVRLGDDQDKLMQFLWFSSISKILLALLYFVHGFVPSWGWAIVVMTVFIKLLFWPLTAYSARSSKRMQMVAEPMKALREKHKENPQRMQQEMMKLYKEYGVNPLAGCLPMLIQLPIFFGLFGMLRTSSELRLEPFLWVADLSMPDTVAEVFGFPLNILPLLYGVTLFFQMHLMPMSPGMDPMQQKIMKWFPMVFLVILYNFSSGLMLYWTVQNVLSIIQTVMIYRKMDTQPLPAAQVPVPSGTKVPAKTAQRPHGPNRTQARKKKWK